MMTIGQNLAGVAPGGNCASRLRGRPAPMIGAQAQSGPDVDSPARLVRQRLNSSRPAPLPGLSAATKSHREMGHAAA